MRNRNHKMPLVALGLLVVCSAPAKAGDAASGADDHRCSLPSNIRSRVDHCNQVGDFGGPEREMQYKGRDKSTQGFQFGGAQANPVIPKNQFSPAINETPGTEAYRRFKKKSDTGAITAPKDQMLEIKSDSQPLKKEKEPGKEPDKEPPKEK